ncbi:hypothetical protein J4423_04340 [Candidatus Pacearchaeota archaeon]|nr:hypothetical protein [Candidatus Pacearchaeota archaeon]
MKRELKFVNYILAGIVIGMLVYIVGIGPSTFNARIESIKGDSAVDSIAERVVDSEYVDVSDTDSSSVELTPAERCESEFDKYSKIGESKYDEIDFSLTLTKEINNDEEAKEFDDTYSGFLSGKLLSMDLSTFKIIKHDYPIIALLVEFKVNQDSGESVPINMILYCSGSGVVSEQSKKMLTLSN